MDRKQMCVSNVKYKKPTQNEAKRMKRLLGYLTYRESRTEKARHAGGRERWLDREMGGSVAEIADRCDAYQSEHVLLFSVVINPQPDLIRMVPPERREQFVRQLTERERQQPVVYEEKAHGIRDNEPVWAGVRRTDDDTSAAGVYGWFEDREGRKWLQFRSIFPDIDHEEAEIAAEVIRERLKAEAHEIERADDPHLSIDFSDSNGFCGGHKMLRFFAEIGR